MSSGERLHLSPSQNVANTMTTKAARSIIAFRGANYPGRYVWSPFVTKLEFRFRLSDLPHSTAAGSPPQGPRGKIPYVGISTPGSRVERLGDSALIIKDFIARGWLQDLDAALTPKELGQDLAIRALLEEKLFFYHTHERWIDNYYTMRDYALAKVPFPQRYVVGYLAHRAIVQKLLLQGTGRFSKDEIHAFRREIWMRLNGMLEESRQIARAAECFWVLGGEDPTEADATVYGFAVSTLVAAVSPSSQELLKADCPAVVDYALRIHRRFFPDYELWN